MGNAVSCCLPWNAPQLSATSQPTTSNATSQPTTSNVVDPTYTMLDEIGNSSIDCTVYRVSSKATGEVFACKSIRITDDSQAYQNEVMIMESLVGHKNIVQLKEVVFELPWCVHIIMELCEGGELLDGVIRIGHRYSEKKAAGIFREIVSIISTCHSAGVIHRDLKPENLMFLTMEEDSPIKAIDFGLSTLFKPEQTLASSMEYKRGQEADIWSAGVILCILLTGFPPFFKNAKRGDIDYSSGSLASVSRLAKQLVEEMLKVDPEERISVSDILSHPWVREGGEASDEPLNISVIGRMERFRSMCKYRKMSPEIEELPLLTGEDRLCGLLRDRKEILPRS